MKILLIRHGESEDDLIDAYGGWADFHLTEKGKGQIKSTAAKIKNLNIKFDKILSSPLFRAKESAEIISKELNIPLEIYEYVKERNSYGILCGMVKAEAKEKYPWLVDAYNNGEYVDGSEREADINNRAATAWKLMLEMNVNNLAVLTHGVFLKALIPHILDRKLTKKKDGGFILLDINDNEVEILLEDGIEVEK